ncbi:MAG: AAA family ATPase [Bacteroidota bacterium]
MLDAIGFDNYRIFDKETILNLKPITILTGPNSSGKSSVIKAAKLLKLNGLNFDGGATGLPYKMDFLPDEYGHFLSSFTSIINAKNVDRNNLSFILPLTFIYFKEKFYSRLTYAPNSNIGKTANRVGFTLLIKDGHDYKEVLHLQGCDGDIFSEIVVNFSLVKRILESNLTPMLEKFIYLMNNPIELKEIGIDEGLFLNEIKNILMLSVRDSGINSLLDFTTVANILAVEKWAEYDKERPILPFYQVLMFNNNEEKKNFYLSDWYSDNKKLFEIAKAKFNQALNIDITQILNRNQKRKAYNFFKRLESDFFDYLTNNRVVLPFQQFNESDFSQGWKGVILDNTIEVNEEDHQLVTSKETKDNLLGFEPFKELLLLYQTLQWNSLSHIKSFNKTNNDLLTLFIRRLAAKTALNFGIEINKFDFFDPNRIEQSLFYHSTNAPAAFNLLTNIETYNYNNDGEKDNYISNQLKFLGIADGFDIEKNDLGIFTILLRKNGIKRPLAEYGYGITKIFFLLLAIDSKLFHTLFIEEPETNLHPDLQSKLADIIVEAQKRPMTQFIIETHSEYFIRKLQFLVAKNEIEVDKILINYFNPASFKETEGIVKEIRIQEDGSLSQDFGPGFFDEALNWKFELMKLKNLN